VADGDGDGPPVPKRARTPATTALEAMLNADADAAYDDGLGVDAGGGAGGAGAAGPGADADVLADGEDGGGAAAAAALAAHGSAILPPLVPYLPAPPGHLKIVSFNIVSVAASLRNGLKRYVDAEDPDVLCLQETKVHANAVPMRLLPAYPHEYWCCSEKKGYSGTAVFSKLRPLAVTYGLPQPEHNTEGRAITVEYESFILVNTYVPNAGQRLVRLAYRQRWNADLLAYLRELDTRKPVVWVGDLNVAHTPIDLARPKANTHSAGFTEEERRDMSAALAAGFVDTFRHFNPDVPHKYTYWGYRHNAHARNLGWRLDYAVVSQRLLPRVRDSAIRAEAYGASDHVPIVLTLAL
jgi:exodeoxyribonuclease III